MARYLDLETISHPRLDEWLSLDDVKARKGTKDEAKIEAQRAEKLAARMADAALEGKLNRIVVWGERDAHTDNMRVLLTEDEERACLEDFWTQWRNTDDEIVGFGLIDFDFPTIIMRSWLLGVIPAITRVDPYRPGRVVDLKALLGQGNKFAHGTLTWWCKRFGITVHDDTDGGDVAAMYAAGNYDGILAHCRADLDKTQRLHQCIITPRSDAVGGI